MPGTCYKKLFTSRRGASFCFLSESLISHEEFSRRCCLEGKWDVQRKISIESWDEAKWNPNVTVAEEFTASNFLHANILKYLNPISHNPLLMLTLNSSLGICFSPFLGSTSLKEIFSGNCRSRATATARKHTRRKHHLNTEEYVCGWSESSCCRACHQWYREKIDGKFHLLSSELRETFREAKQPWINYMLW